MRTNAPISASVVDSIVENYQLEDLGRATIREIVSIVNDIEAQWDQKFIRMEMGVPGLSPSPIGLEAEIEALRRGVASDYPMLEGIKPLKENTSRFVKAFMNLDVSPVGCVPTVGSMQGGYAAFMLACQLHPQKKTILFVDPGFPVQKQQVNVMGYNIKSFDVFNFRGQKLRDKLESLFAEGDIAAIVYSNPNNPAWICLQEEELQIIGELSKKHDVIVIEDLAYFAMDFRKDLSTPYEPPFQATVGKYTDQYLLLISSSKVFSYAGQRIGIMVMSDALYNRQYSTLKERYGVSKFGVAMVSRLLYTLSSGTSHSAQYALSAMFDAAVTGQYRFLDDVKEYEKRAALMKAIFIENGFELVYSSDLDMPLADGFYFTISYPGMDASTLTRELMYYGISAIALYSTGSEREGLRACVSQTKQERFGQLRERLDWFRKDHPVL
jgi:aspartate/methionine/tyrosine aminotransferase